MYGSYGSPAYGYACQLVGDRDLAADVVQEAFLSLWQASDACRPERGSMGALLLTLAHHRAVDTLRRRAHRPEVALDDTTYDRLNDGRPTPEEAVCRADLYDGVLAVVSRLTPIRKRSCC